MALPILTPVSTTTTVRLSASATSLEANQASAYPYTIYVSDQYFLSGAAEQVAFVYKRLGGDVLDIEITNQNVFAAYQEACLEYSYIVNIHQAKNSLSSLLGNTTGSFDNEGTILTGSTVYGQNIALKYPRFIPQMARKISNGFAVLSGLGGDVPSYSASIALTQSVQDYDLQSIVDVQFPQLLGKRILINKVYYESPNVIWGFFGYLGGMGALGGLTNYSMFANGSTFEVIPTFQTKLQIMAYEDSINMRISQFSYEIIDNNLRLYPVPRTTNSRIGHNMWFRFSVLSDNWIDNVSGSNGINGINNFNGLPFENIPFQNINSMGKHFIRRYCLALCKETLSQVRGKFGGSVPAPGITLTLNSSVLAAEAKEEKQQLREELVKILDELTYNKLAEQEMEKTKNSAEVLKYYPTNIFVG